MREWLASKQEFMLNVKYTVVSLICVCTSARHVKTSTIMKLELAYAVYITVCSYIHVDRPLATAHNSSNVAAILVRKNKYKLIAIH